MITTPLKTTARGWYVWRPDEGRWAANPAENSRPDWENTIICDVFRPDARGVSRWVRFDELRDVYQQLCPDNPTRALALFGGPGGNGSNFFTRPSYGFAEFIGAKRPDWSREETRMQGLNSNVRPKNQAIPQVVRNHVLAKPCAFTGLEKTALIVDHKDGRHNTESQSVEDYQPLLGEINKLKGTHCSRCIATNQRFDAKTLGYEVGWTVGGERYEGSCIGCYWYDVHAFRGALVLPE
jgi:hypothetical protein